MSFVECNILKIEDGFELTEIVPIGIEQCWRFRPAGDILYLEYRIFANWMYIYCFENTTAGNWNFQFSTTMSGDYQLDLYKGNVLVAGLGTAPNTGTLDCWQYVVSHNQEANLVAVINAVPIDSTLSNSNANPNTCTIRVAIPFNYVAKTFVPSCKC